MGGGPAGRRIVYYVLVVAGAVLIHLAPLSDLVGADVTDFLRRNSEAYVLMVLVPLYWDAFGWAAWPESARAAPRRRGWWQDPRWLIWLGVLALAAILTQSDVLEVVGVELRPSIVTLGEAFVAGVVISIYVAWSRAIPTWGETGHGAPVVTAARRTVYYVLAAAVSMLAYQTITRSLLGDGFVDWLVRNVEALSAVLILPAYFDVMRSESARWVRVGWYAALFAVPALAQSGALDDLAPDGVVDWLQRSTEAFIAGIGVSLYFDVWRGKVGHGAVVSPSIEVAEDVG